MTKRFAGPIVIAVVLVATFGAFLLHPDSSRAGAILEVNSTLDSDDGSCDALAGANECTLREALNLAGNNDTIRFQIPTTDPNCTASLLCTISPGSQLPDLDGVGKTVNGYSQSGATENSLNVGNNAVIKIQIDMSAIQARLFNVTGADMTIRGLAIYDLTGNTPSAIHVDGADGTNIRGNFLGIKANGNPGAAGALNWGVYLDGATNSTIGGIDEAQRNVISGLVNGVFIGLDSGGSDVFGNYIGTNPDGTAPIPNIEGITLTRLTDTQIGDASSVLGRNVISGNEVGIKVGLGQNTAGLQIQGNYIGIKADGTQALGNDKGIWFQVASRGDTLVGGVDAGNIISGNEVGIQVDSDKTDLRIEGNRIGTNPAGTDSIFNVKGIEVLDADELTIGGELPGQGNLISGNVVSAVWIDLTSLAPADVVIAGNKVGTNLAGTADLDVFEVEGIHIIKGDGVVIGGDSPGARNIISGNGIDGISIGENASNTVVRRNYIGTDHLGLTAITQNFGIVDDGSGTEISLNVISGSTFSGLLLEGTDTLVQGNKIGTNVLLGPLGNSANGIQIKNGATGRIENVPAGPPNVIANNGGDGVNFEDPAANASFTISRNSIFSNGGLAIDFGPDGVTPNDANDSDSGANDRQNWPVLTSAESGSTLVRGTLDTLPNRAYTFEMFSVAACDASGNGEGALYGGAATLNTDSDGFITFAVQSSATAVVGSFITATVTDQTTGDTSEFSNCVPVVAAPTPSPTPSPTLPGQTPTPTPSGPTPTPTTTPIPIETPPPSGEVTDGPTPTATATPTPTAVVTPTPSGQTEEPTTPGASGSPTETPTPTATPGTPSPTPTGAGVLRQGDNDCSGVVTGRDSLFAFLFIAQLTGEGFPPCPAVGADIGFIWGNVDCDGDVDADDGIKLLMWLAGFDVEQVDPCNDIGEAFPS